MKGVIAETIARAMQSLCILNRKFKGERISRKIDNRFWLTVVHLDLTFTSQRVAGVSHAIIFFAVKTSNVSQRTGNSRRGIIHRNCSPPECFSFSYIPRSSLTSHDRPLNRCFFKILRQIETLWTISDFKYVRDSIWKTVVRGTARDCVETIW